MLAWIPNPVNLPQNHHVCIRNRLCVNIFLSLVNIVAVITCQYWKVNFCIVVLSNLKRLFLKVTLFPKKSCNVQVFYGVYHFTDFHYSIKLNAAIWYLFPTFIGDVLISSLLRRSVKKELLLLLWWWWFLS